MFVTFATSAVGMGLFHIKKCKFGGKESKDELLGVFNSIAEDQISDL